MLCAYEYLTLIFILLREVAIITEYITFYFNRIDLLFLQYFVLCGSNVNQFQFNILYIFFF